MQMLYNSDSFVVVQFDVPSAVPTDEATPDIAAALGRGGFEIVDKFARKEIFLEGALAQSFKEGVEALMQNGPSEDEIDDYIGRYTQLAQQPVVLH
jgi:hypothetical protein